MIRYRDDRESSHKVDPRVVHRLGKITRIVAKRILSSRLWYLTTAYFDGKEVHSEYTKRYNRTIQHRVKKLGFDPDACEYNSEKRYTTTDREILMVYGEKGSARFSGVCWGYQGEGPRTVIRILVECGVPEDIARDYAFHGKRNHAPGIDWEIDMKALARQIA